MYNFFLLMYTSVQKELSVKGITQAVTNVISLVKCDGVLTITISLTGT